MTEPTDQQTPAEPHEGIDAFANVEARDHAENQSQPLARAGGEGPPPTDAPPAGTAPIVEGTGAGDALAGVRVEDEDAAAAVKGDDGPEHGGVRRNT
ncbi:MAG: hypothetical protein M3Y06_06700 [Actinomycetota bacterium]|nr:hypothetical protein [Actinomycetota bacterium]